MYEQATMSLFCLITLTGTSFRRDAFYGSKFLSSFNDQI